MKIFIIQLLTLSFVNSCNSDMENTIWVIYKISKEINDENVEDTFAIDHLLNKKFDGTKIFIEKNKIKIKGNNFDMEGKVVEITPEIIFIKDKGKEFQIQYFLSSDKRECEFILADGTRFRAKKEN